MEKSEYIYTNSEGKLVFFSSWANDEIIGISSINNILIYKTNEEETE